MKTSAILLTMLSLALAGCRDKVQEPNDPAAPKVAGESVLFVEKAPQLSYLSLETAAPSEREEINFCGRVAWDEDHTARVYSPVAGRVVGVKADLGRTVSSGDVLALLASPDYGQVQSDAKKAASDLALADRTLSRERELFAHGAAAQKDVEAAQADYDKAVSERQRAEAQLAALGNAGPNTGDGVYSLQCPVAGVVAEKNIVSGQQVRSDAQLAGAPQFFAPLFVVSDPGKLWLFLDVTDMDAPRLKPGQEIHVHSKAYPDHVFSGHLEKIGDALDPSTRTIKARATLANPDHLLKAEMYVTAEIVSDGAKGVAVSAKAMFLKNNQYYCFVESAPGRFERRAITLGIQNGSRITIITGVDAGQQVVTEGCLLLQNILENGANS